MGDTSEVTRKLEWLPISIAPKDRLIEVFAPGAAFDLPDFIGLCKWHDDAGFCVCELREPTHWRPHNPPASTQGV